VRSKQNTFFVSLLLFFIFTTLNLYAVDKETKRFAYIVSDLRIPYWSIMERGMLTQANALGVHLKTYSAQNDAKKELEFLIKAIKDKVDGIIISPTNSAASVMLLRLAKSANIPVVILDIGTDEGEYVSYVFSNNKEGGYESGKILVEEFQVRGWQNKRVGIIAIPQKRVNGQERTAGFMKALKEAQIRGAGIKQQVDFSYKETYEFSKELISQNPDLGAIWLQGSDRYKGALDAISEADKEGEVLLLCFDAEPEFIEMIRNKELLVVGMQQPFLMGQKAVFALYEYLNNKVVEKHIEIPMLSIHFKNIDKMLPLIKKNVLGQNF
jgi:ribose transport system substrate-binding protein